MGKIVLFLPDHDMIGQALQILQNQEYHIDTVRRVETKHIVAEAEEAVKHGADVIIARGNQAMYIKQKLDVPVVDIRATGQELGLLLTKAKQLSEKQYPKIAVIANKNMLPDTAHMGEIYGVELKVYIVYSNIDIHLLVKRVAETAPDVIIGGSNVIKEAQDYQIKTVYFSLTQDGLREAFRVAEMMKYARDIEKKGNAQIQALTDNSFTGILRTDKDGSVLLANDLMKNILHKKDVAGKHLLKLFPQLESREIMRVLEEGGMAHNSYTVIHDQAVSLIATPVVVENEVEGLILFCYPVKNLHRSSGETKGRRFGNRSSFQDLIQESEAMKACLHQARAYTPSSCPVLILGEAGTETYQLAHILYHSGEQKYDPLIEMDCRTVSTELRESADMEKILGREIPDQCVLLFQNLECLSRNNQAGLMELLCGKPGQRAYLGEERKIRLLATGDPDRFFHGEAGFLPEFYYHVSGFLLQIPPLRERKEDLEQALEQYFDYYRKKYSRYFTLTKGARAYLLSLPWYGNFPELEQFCEKMILLSDNRMITEEFVRQIAGENTLGGERPERREQEREEKRISELLEKHHGDRQKIADELGISKVTLWRRMKKYGLE